MKRSNLFLLSLTVLLASCGGGNDDATAPSAQEPLPTPAPAPAPAPTLTTIDSKVLGAAGGSLAIPEAIATVPAGTVNSNATFTLSRFSDEVEATDFGAEVSAQGVSDYAAFGLHVTTDASELHGDGIKVKISVSAVLDALVAAGQTIAAFAQGTDEVDDPEKGESHQTFEPIFGTYDAAAKVLTVVVPASAFEADGANLKAKLRVAALPEDFTPSAPLAIGPRIAALPTAASCPANASFKAPMAYGWVEGASSTTQQRPIAAVVGPFNEARKKGGKPTKGHQGIDFIGQIGTPIFAVADGYIQRARNENYDCPTTAGVLPKLYKKDNVKNPEYSITLNVAGGELVTYRHIKEGSAGVYTRSTVAKEASFDTCFSDIKKLPTGQSRKYPVKAGQQIAMVGKSGELSPGTRVGPHLHFEWLPPVGDHLHKNPLCRLAQLPDSGNPAEMNALAPVLAGQVQPGALAAPSLPSGGTTFVVRRRRVTNPCTPESLPGAACTCTPESLPGAACTPANVCRVDTPDGSTCDIGGPGFYMAALVRPYGGEAFPLDSNGVMATKVLFKSDDTRVTYGSSPTTAAGLISSLYVPFSPAPPINVLADRGHIDLNPPCNISAEVTYQVEVQWNRANTAKEAVRAPFGPPTKYKVTTFPRPIPQVGCASLATSISGSN